MFRWPAEWEKQVRTFVGWPDSESEWQKKLDDARLAAAALAREIGSNAVVCVGHSMVSDVRALVGDAVEITQLRSGDIWLRDTGPLWLVNAGERRAVSFRWTGWGGKYMLEDDDSVALELATTNGAPLTRSPIAAEGGALETNGAGICITTRQCLLNDNRNPGKSQLDIETALADLLGIEQTVWLDRGLAGDHTDGHVDNLARFVNVDLACVAVSESSDPNHEIHQEVSGAVRRAGLEVAPLPSPGAFVDERGELAPASYLNFVIANDVVCVPTFERATDDDALNALDALFPDRRIVGVDARALLYGGGALHCMTNHLPAAHG